MKVIAICACGALGFLVMGYQAGMFERPAASQKAKTVPPPPPRAPFPETLMHACQGKPVPQAVEYKKTAGPHPLVFFHVNKKNQWEVYEPWQDKVHDEWKAETVEKAELVIILDKDRKIFVDRNHFDRGPPVDRFSFELNVFVRSAKTGDLLCHKRFINHPRQVKQIEEHNLTALGQPVAFKTVMDWLRSQSQIGFVQDNTPIVTVMKYQ